MDNTTTNTTTSLSFLTKGSKVEVSSTENDSTGAWYVATVIHPPPSIISPNHHTRNNLVYVEYHNLLSDDGSSTRLREYANISYVRPSPVPDSNPPNFQLNDVVEAFYRDGWWTGVVTGVVDTCKFVVSFENPSEEVEFGGSELRLHKKWVAGKWVQPQKQEKNMLLENVNVLSANAKDLEAKLEALKSGPSLKESKEKENNICENDIAKLNALIEQLKVTAGWMFTVGKKVEVSFEKESLRDVWFPATVLKNSGNSTFLVEYRQPGAGDEGVLQKVTVDYHHIRPSPPHLRDKNFVLLEKVDAYYDFGWWCGVITKALADNRYNVFFKHTKKEQEFIYSRVRPHMEWKGGKWFSTSQGDAAVRTPHSLIDNKIEQATPIIGKQSSVATSVMKSEHQKNLDSNDKTSPNDETTNDDSVIKKKRTSVGQSEGIDSEARGMTDQTFNKKAHSLADNQIEQATPNVGKQSPVATSIMTRKRQKHRDSNDKTSPDDEITKDDSSKKVKHSSVGQPEGVDSEVSGKKGDTAVKTAHSLIDNQSEQETPITGKRSLVATSITKSKRQKNLDSNDKTSPNDEIVNDDSSKKEKHPSVGQPEGVDSEASGMTDKVFSKKGDTAVRTADSLLDIPMEQATSIIGKQSPVATSILTRKRQKILDSSDKTSSNDELMNDDSSKKEKHPSVSQPKGVGSEVSEMTDQAFSKTENLSHGKKVYSKRGKSIEPKVPTTVSSKKKGKGSRLINELNSLQTLTDGSEVDSVKPRTRATVEQEDATEDFVFVVMGLQCNKMTVSQEEMVQNLPDENNQDVAKTDTTQLDVVPLASLTEVDQEGSEGNVVSVALKRKRGRPFKSQALSAKTPATVDNEIRNVVPSTLSVVEDGQRKEVDLATSSETKSLEENQGPVNEQPVAEKQNESLVKDKLPNENTDLHLQDGTQTKRYPARKRKQAKRRTISINAKSPAQDSRDASKEKADGSLEKNSTTEASVGVDSLVTEGTYEQSSKASEGWLTSGNLPFIKSTALWKTLESMDAFRMLPQKPHFHPLLEGVREGAQEGLAIGTMVTFSTMFDKTRSLRLDDPRSAIEDCLETLVELENNGFDVKALRERLTGLLLIKDKEEGLKEKSKGFVEKLKEDKTDGKRIEEEMKEINRQMRELEERKKQAMLKKEKRLWELRVMETVIDGIKQEIREVEAEFDELAAAPFVV